MITTAYARRLRYNMTQAEQTLWRYLRRKQLDGFKFRRQCPIGPYIADFVCWKAKLIVELDGGHHSDQVESDAERSRWLGTQGFRVLRFWNRKVLQETDNVVEAIRAKLTDPSSNPSSMS